MARRCQLTGKQPQFGHNVSHSNRKTNRRFDPNLQRTTLYSEALRRNVGLRVCTRALRTVTRAGGLDAYLLRADDAKLAPEGLRLKRQVKKALAGTARTAASSQIVGCGGGFGAGEAGDQGGRGGVTGSTGGKVCGPLFRRTVESRLSWVYSDHDQVPQ